MQIESFVFSLHRNKDSRVTEKTKPRTLAGRGFKSTNYNLTYEKKTFTNFHLNAGYPCHIASGLLNFC